jgi:hypothetical protein
MADIHLPDDAETRAFGRHAGLDPASRFFSGGKLKISGTPGQARGDDNGGVMGVTGAMDIVFGECDR